MQIVQELNG
jgi:chromosome segregation ATPase